MHLVEKLVVDAISQTTHCLAVGLSISALCGCPSPSTGVGVALDGDVLRGSADRANGIDSCLVELSDKSRRFIMKFIVGIKDDLFIVLELCSNGFPESRKVLGRSDDCSVVTTVVVRYDDGIGTKLSNPINSLCEIAKVCGVQGTSHLIGHQTLHQEVHTEAVIALVDECVDGVKIGPSIVRS